MQTGPRFLTEEDLNTLTTSKQTQFGAQGITEDGREFRYVSFGGTTTINPGTLVETTPLAAQTNSQGLTITASGTGGQVSANLATGSTTLVLTGGGTSYTQDEFAEGFLDVIVGASGSVTGTYTYRIKGNTVSTATNGYTTIYLATDEPLRNTTALVPGTDTANLRVSPYANVVASTAQNAAIGLNLLPVVNSATVTNYGWVQTRGNALAVGDGTSIAIGSSIMASATSGQVGLTTTVKTPIGTALVANSTATSAVPVVLNVPLA